MVFLSLLFAGKFNPDCPQVFGRLCNDMGTCTNGICICTDPFFSGEDCATTLVKGYNVITNEKCLSRGFVGAFLMKKEDLIDECNEKASSYFRRDGWNNEQCIRETANKIKRIQLTSPEEAYRDVFTIPRCVCQIPYSGESCEIEYCPRNLGSNEICSGNGNKSVSRAANGSSLALADGCQCSEDIIYLLDSTILMTYEAKDLQTIKDVHALDMSQPFCGKLISHPEIPRLKIIWQAEYQYKCFCDERGIGPVCTGVCPENELGQICSNNGHPKLGFGADLNTPIRYTDRSSPICTSPERPYSCGSSCKPNKESCDKPDICPPDKPIRCRSGICVEKPFSDLGLGQRHYGLIENINVVLAKKRCYASTIDNSAAFIDDFEYNETLVDCIGSRGTYQNNSFLYPAGIKTLSTSLVAIEVISTSVLTSMRVIYRTREIRLEGKGTLLYLYNTSYEEEADRLFSPLKTQFSIRLQDRDTILVYPAPFLFSSSKPVPTEYQTLSLRSNLGLFNARASSTISFIEESPTSGDWFAASMTTDLSRIVIPGGAVISKSACLLDPRQCLWNVETRLSYDKTRKLCHPISSSKNLNCVIRPLLDTHVRFQTVLVAELETPDEVIDWTSLGPWFMGLASSIPFDLSSDVSDLEIFTSPDSQIVSISFLDINDIAIASACPSTLVNASTLDSKWIDESARRSTHIKAGANVVGRYNMNGQRIVIRGVATAEENRMLKQGYIDPITVEEMKFITIDESRRGLKWDDYRVLGSICPDGSSGSLIANSVSTDVSCDCIMKTSRLDTDCECYDRYALAFSCKCSSGGNKCVCDDEKGDLYELQETLARYLNTTEGVCFLSQFASDEINYVTGHADGNSGIYEFESLYSSAYLVELRISPCISAPTLMGHASLYSDVPTNIPIDYYCHEGTNMTLKANLSDFQTTYDRWLLGGINVTTKIIALFSPGGVSIKPVSVTASTNQVNAENVLWNDFSFWSSSTPDRFPTITLVLPPHKKVHAFFVVFKTVGLYVNANVTIPVQVSLQSSEDGITFTTLGSVTSDVVDGFVDMYTTLEIDTDVVHSVRLRSAYPLSVREFVVFGNEYCDRDDMDLIISPEADFMSLQVTSITKILESIGDKARNYDQCLSVDACILNDRQVLPTDDCFDEIYKPKDIKFTLVSTLASSRLFKDINDSMFFDSNFTTSGNVNAYYFVNETLAVWSLMTPFPGSPEDAVNISGAFTSCATNILCVPRPETVFLVRDLQAREQFTVILDDGTIQFYNYTTAFERREVCAAGTQRTACGNNLRTVPLSPGSNCELTEYEQMIRADFINRSDHVVGNTALINDFLHTGLISVQIRGIKIARNVTQITRTGCKDCFPFSPCPDGTCSETCNTTRWDNYGDGCTRVSLDIKEFTCACKTGYGGVDCSLDYCLPGDPETGLVGAEMWCSCGSDPPIKARPPFSLLAPKRGCYLTKELNQLNINNDKIHHSFAPYGIPFLRCYREGGRLIRSNCPFYKIGPFGQKITFEQSVIRDQNQTIIGYVQFETAIKGVFVQYEWENGPFTHDESGYRCPNSYGCLRTKKDCYNDFYINPPCGGNGAKCRVDGTCDCPSGTKTFLYTEEWTNIAKVPYSAENPTIWGREYTPIKGHCAAKNCSDPGVVCSAPLGCYSGSKQYGFKDRHIACPLSSTHGGKCGKDLAACGRGEVTDSGVCSFNGIPRIIDYAGGEERCYCGSPRSKLVSLLKTSDVETVQLEPNGWGGDFCQTYYCSTDLSGLHWSYVNPLTLSPYVDDELVRLPGKWVGGKCGQHIGPDPDDSRLWHNCCPGLSRLSRCNKVICKIAGVPTCVEIEECKGSDRTPMEFQCNNKGKARADGSCECDNDPRTGVGYGPGADGLGCYTKLYCPVAKNGQVCNSGITDSRFWTRFPKVEGLEDQISSLALKQGINPTSENLVKFLFGEFENRKKLVLNALVQIAIRVRNDIAAAAGSICISSANESCSNPPGMLPYCGKGLGKYMQSFKSPFQIRPVNSSGILFDYRFQYENSLGLTQPKQDEEYLVVTQVTLSFSKDVTITGVRLFGKVLTPKTNFTFTKDDGISPACSSFAIDVMDNYDWIEPVDRSNNIHYCEQQWQGYDFKDELGWRINCAGNEARPECHSFIDNLCKNYEGYVIVPASSLELYKGCDNRRCCVPISPEPTPTLNMTIKFSSPVRLQEVVLFGYYDTVQELSQPLLKELNHLQGRSFEKQCVHYPYLSSLFEEDGNYYRPRDFLGNGLIGELGNLTENTGRTTCELSGGVLAAQRTTQEELNYQARTYGEACYKGRSLTGDNTGCLIGAKDRNDVLKPVLTDFFHESCSIYGCFHCSDGSNDCRPETYGEFITKESIVDYVSSGDNGSQWMRDWTNGTILSWGTYAQRMSLREEMQKAMIIEKDQTKNIGVYASQLPDERMIFFFELSRPHISWRPATFIWWKKTRYAYTLSQYYEKDTDFDNVWKSNQGNGRNGLDNILYGNKNDYTYTQNPVSSSQFPVRPSSSSSDQKYNTGNVKSNNIQHDVWTEDTTCKIEFFSQPNCGSMGFKGIGAGYQFYSKHVIVVTPSNDYADLFENILNSSRTFDTCDLLRLPVERNYQPNGDQWSFQTDYYRCHEVIEPFGYGDYSYGSGSYNKGFQNYDNVNCRDFGRHISEYKSVSVNGPCAVEVRLNSVAKQIFTEIQPGFARAGPKDTLANPYFHSIYRLMGDNNGANQCHFFNLGCAPECKGSRECVGVGYGLSYTQFPMPRVGQYGGSYGGGDGGTQSDPVVAHEFAGTVPRFINDRPKLSVRIFPLFSNFKVKQSVRSEVAKFADQTKDDFILGSLDHQFMCSRVDIFTTKGFLSTVDGTVNLGWVTNLTYRNYAPNFAVLFNSSFSSPFPSLQEAQNEQLDSSKGMLIPCSTLTRPVVQCPSCIKQQPQPKWQWDPRYLNPLEASVKVELNRIRQYSYYLSPEPTEPQLFLTSSSSTNPIFYRSFHPLVSWKTDRPRVYARQISILRIVDYRVKFFVDRCLQVIRYLGSLTTSISFTNKYVFDTAICEKPAYNSLCQREFIKYAVQAGYQCDDCGPSSGAGSVLRPGMTVFDIYPRARVSDYPKEHAIYTSYTDGTLETYLTTGYVDYDSIYNFIRTKFNDSVVFGFPNARKYLDKSYSDRPGLVSPNSIADPNHWVNFDWKSTWPVDCGEQCSSITGLCRKRLATRYEYCPSDSPQFSLTLIPDIEYPRSLLPVTDDNPTTIKRCGYVVDLTTYGEFDDAGPVSPVAIRFITVDRVKGDFIKLKLTRTTSSWYNSYKPLGYTFTKDTTITGSFECPRFNCSIAIWVSSTSIYGSIPLDKTIVSVVYSGLFEISLASLGNNTFKTLGIDFVSMQRGDIVKLVNFLATDPTTIAECKRNLKRDIHELPSSIDIANPDNVCVFDAGVDLGAKCDCKNPALDGPTCESPSFVGKVHGKKVCGSYGVEEQNILTTGGLTKTDTDGVFYEGDSPKCNCLDLGRALQTVLDPVLQFNYRFVYISDRLFFEPEYVLITGSDIPDGLRSPFDYGNTIRGLTSNSLSLVSWYDGDSATDYISNFGRTGVITDLGRTEEGNFAWENSALDFVLCENDSCLQNLANPCVAKGSVFCQAVQFNNLAFNRTTNGLTDGTISSFGPLTVGALVIPLRWASSKGVTVELKVSGTPLISFVQITGSITPCATTVPFIYDCFGATGINSITITVSGPGGSIVEAFVYEEGDLTRFYDYF